MLAVRVRAFWSTGANGDPSSVVYEGIKLADVGFRMDMLVENEIILEIKVVEAVAPVHLAQLVSYLRMANRRVGLLLNFNVVDFKKGIFGDSTNFDVHGRDQERRVRKLIRRYRRDVL